MRNSCEPLIPLNDAKLLIFRNVSKYLLSFLPCFGRFIV